MQTFTNFKVAGETTFPFDMLRWDCCYPASEEAVREMTALSGQRTVELCQDHDAAMDPSIAKDRWASYGWPVVDTKTDKSKEPGYTYQKRNPSDGDKALSETMSRAEIDEIFPFLKSVSFQTFVLVDLNGIIYRAFRKD